MPDISQAVPVAAVTAAAIPAARPVTWPAEGWTVLRPLGAGDVALGAGFWADRLQVNDETSLAVALARLERAGNLDNLRIAAGQLQGDFRGREFADTDVYKWLEALSWRLQRSPSPMWDRTADEVIALIAAAQRPDGYLDTSVQIAGAEPWSDLVMGHELYCAGHLFQAAVAHHRATGASGLLDVAVRFADLIVAVFGVGGPRVGYCGHPEIETAVVELYRETGERSYLELAARMISLRGSGLLGEEPYGRGYFQDDVAVREAVEVRGHAVRALYLAAGVTDLYLETGEALLLQRLEQQWADMVDGKLYITGGAGSRHRDEAFGDRYELPSDRAYTETCATVAGLHWAWRMTLATGEARHAELFERTLYNGFLSGVSLDGTRFLYVNPLHRRDGGTSGPDTRQEWFDCSCCPPNVMRMLAALPHYLCTRDADGVQLHQYAAASVRTVLADGTPAGCDIATDYPLHGGVDIVVPPECAGHWTLSLRIPEWSVGASLDVDGESLDAKPGGYAVIERTWKGGESIKLRLPMAARMLLADARIDALRGAAAIERGPLVYCFEGLDQGIDIEQVAMCGFPEDGPTHPELTGVPTLTVPGRPMAVAPGWPYRDVAAGPASTAAGAGGPDEDPVSLRAIPYYAWANRSPTPMRVWLPVTSDLARGEPIAD